MANDFEISIDIDAPPDVVWDLAGDPGASDIWIPVVSSVRVDGDIRYVTMVGGGTLRERLVDRDEQLRTFSYEILDGVPNLLEHRGTIRVEEIPAGSRVHYRQTAKSSNPGYDIEAPQIAAALGDPHR